MLTGKDPAEEDDKNRREKEANCAREEETREDEDETGE